jgi:anti-sigma regulatory factor (Ser/Thr protein kinase)
MDTLTLPGRLDQLDEVGEFIMHAAQDAGLEKRSAYKLRLAVDEIATNAITHGYQEAGLEGDIRLEIEDGDEKLTVRLYDTGQAYDPDDVVDPGEDLHRPLEERPIGGLGVFLSIQSVDKFSYERNGDTNCHTFVMNK